MRKSHFEVCALFILIVSDWYFFSIRVACVAAMRFSRVLVKKFSPHCPSIYRSGNPGLHVIYCCYPSRCISQVSVWSQFLKVTPILSGVLLQITGFPFVFLISHSHSGDMAGRPAWQPTYTLRQMTAEAPHCSCTRPEPKLP